jgi:predicted RNA-binding protein with PUA-like domain
MNRIKKFEAFDFNQTLPIASKEDLTLFYSCDECNGLWKDFNNESEVCRFCDSTEIEELSSDEYYDMVKSRLEDDEIQDLDIERKKDTNTFVDIYNLKNNRKNVN